MQALDGRAGSTGRRRRRSMIDLLFDTCLPITVDEVVLWQTPAG